VSYVPNIPQASWPAYGRYLARDGAQPDGAGGLGFDADRDDVNLTSRLRRWQKAGDVRLWQVVVSPEHGARLDLRAHTRALVGQMQSDLGTRLEWAAIEHSNTDHRHVHLAVRGRDAEDRPLDISPTYIRAGLRARSQELATRVLGFRSEREYLAARGRAVEQMRFTEIDGALLRRADDRGLVTYEGRRPGTPAGDVAHAQEVSRLQFLEGLGLVDQVGVRTWQLGPALEPTLRRARLSGEILGRSARARPAELRAGLPVGEARGARVTVADTAAADREARKGDGRPVVEAIGAGAGAAAGPTRDPDPLWAADSLPRLGTMARSLGRTVLILRPVEGQVYRGRLVGYARESDGQRYAVVDTGAELAAFRTESAELPTGRHVRAVPHEAGGAGRPGILWRLGDGERERERV
jgi:type IV secretory pathway VirD2 relaxase